MLHIACLIAAADVIAGIHAVFKLEGHAARDIAEHVLESEADDGGGYGGSGEDACRVDAQLIEQAEQSGDVCADDDDLTGEFRQPDLAQRDVDDQQEPDLDRGENKQSIGNFAGDAGLRIPVDRHSREQSEGGPNCEKAEYRSDAAAVAMERFP